MVVRQEHFHVSGDPTRSVAAYRTLLGRIARHGFRNRAF